MTITRTPTRATGGITDAERERLRAHAEIWIRRIMTTEHADPEVIGDAIRRLYRAAGLDEPIVVQVPSPLAVVAVGGISAAIWYARDHHHTRTAAATDAATAAATRAATAATRAATDAATRAATDAATAATYDATAAATYAATYAATAAATDAATRAATATATAAATAATSAATDAATATRAATYDATDAATRAATDAATAATYDATAAATSAATDAATRAATRAATDAATADADGWIRSLARTIAPGIDDLAAECVRAWSRCVHGGAMWAQWDCYLTAARDVLGLRLPEHEAYSAWEDAAIHGGYRWMHPRFCIVSDHPAILRVDEQHRPHCADGPSHRWRDGWEIYHWHGVRVPREWIMERDSIDPGLALTHPQIEERRALAEILGWERVLSQLRPRTIDADPDPEIGTLLEVDLPDSGRERFLRVRCGTGRDFVLPVPPDVGTALSANAWTYGIDGDLLRRMEVRT